MWKRMLGLEKSSLKVTIISCGDTGKEIGIGIIKELMKKDVKVEGIAISAELEAHEENSIFNAVILIDKSKDGFAKKLEDGRKAAEKKKTKIRNELKKVLEKGSEGILFVTTGSGATGLGSTLVVLDILNTNFDLKPPVMTLLPEVFENSRVQFNAASFIYEIQYSENARKNPIIILDNKPSLEEMDLQFSEVAKKRIETIPVALADLLVSSFEKSITHEFEADVADLFDVMHTPGISVFVSEILGDELGNVDSSRIEDVISDSVIDTTSLSKDKIFEADSAFICIFNMDEGTGKLNFQTKIEIQKLIREFRETNPFVKFISTKKKKRIPKLRGIIAGLPMPTRILQIMRIAKESRKRIMVDEYNLDYEIANLDIEKVSELEDELNNYL